MIILFTLAKMWWIFLTVAVLAYFVFVSESSAHDHDSDGC